MAINNLLDEGGKLVSLARFKGNAAAACALRRIGPHIPDILTEAGFELRLPKDAVPLPGVYAIMSSAGGGKSTLCRNLDQLINGEHSPFAQALDHDIDYAYITMGEPEDPTTSFSTAFEAVTAFIGDRDPDADDSGSGDKSQNAAIMIVDSLTDLAFTELPRSTRQLEGIDSSIISHVFGVDGGSATLLDAALANPSLYMQPNSAALAGGLTGGYYQLLKRLSTACLFNGIYMFAVLNPLSFDDRGKFRSSVLGSVTAAMSIDQFDAGLVRCCYMRDDVIRMDVNSRAPIVNRRHQAQAEDVSQLFADLLNGGNHVG